MCYVKKIKCDVDSIKKYLSQDNVIHKTTRESNLNYGKIAIMTDSDVDG